jgi:peroxiredoxin
MFRRIIILIGVIGILPLLVFGQYPVGSTAPNFTLLNMQGNSVSLSNYQGKTVLLNFFTTG